jgi:3-hydroxyacyl-CoA dehydrogenase/enoyl-CoA hydratase/3-hydroxybutyryl-CoA epimerase
MLLGAPVLAEFSERRLWTRRRVVCVGKATLIAKRHRRVRQLESEAGAVALVKRGWDSERLAAVRYPTVALVRGFCLEAAWNYACVPISRRRRRARNTTWPARSDARDRTWMGDERLPRCGAPRSISADRRTMTRPRQAPGIADACVPARIMEHRTRHPQGTAARRLPFPPADSESLARRFIAAQARKQVAKRARREHYPAPYAILDIWVKYDGDALACRRRIRRRPSLLNPRRPAIWSGFCCRATEGVRQGRIQGEACVVGAGTMGGDIAAWCALRGLTVTLQDQNAERLRPRWVAHRTLRGPARPAPGARRIRPVDPMSPATA